MAEVEVVTFGCRLNAYESEVIRRAAGRAGLERAVVVNTCAVTAEAERQARQAIRRARREHPDARIIVTGCAATLDPARYRALPEVDAVLDNRAKLDPQSYRFDRDPPAPGEKEEAAEEGDPAATAAHLLDGFAGRARAFLQVQQGCDHRCTFCIIPYARGPSRSLPADVVAARARRLVQGGVREIVLTGVDLTAWGADLPGRPSLGHLARHLLAAVPELPRLRLSSLDPAEIDEELWRLFAAETRLMPHLHLSLQAGDDLVLKRMRRRHSRAQAVATARRARALRPEVALGADLIAGFPTESEAMFRRTLDLIAECGLAFVHVFPYSARPGTPAARMPAVPESVVRERAARLRQAGAAALAADLALRIGGASEVLIERPHLGRSTFYAAVAFAGEGAPGTVRRMRLVGRDADRLIGVPMS
ncbi:MAG TPA: tRNA (N(6)-L-threonylcarbamoyladenosine(37)-C(2))-methylthiotransferase MtaB [Stellaceae bacterium]|nr:tRNA (N(6)-L-threonylcarbamoyladenosine(37)-C(2))-methylthiotransferase MtaB [Stellaceae bacterium]